MRIDVQIDDQATQAALASLPDRLRDYDQLFESLNNEVRANVERQFVTNQQRWADLSPLYAAQKRAAVGDRPKLIRTGEMLAAYHDGGDWQGDTYTFGNDLDRARWHQEGTRRMPARSIDYEFVDDLAVVQTGLFVEAQLNEVGL